MKETLICDISNIACFNKRKTKPKLTNIDLLFAMIPSEFDIIAIADNSLYRLIDEKKRYKREYLLTKKILEAPAQVPADVFILQYAKINDCLIVSNDLFREYEDYSKEWLDTHRISFMIINDQLFLKSNSLISEKVIQINLHNTSVESNKQSILVT